MGTPDRTTSVNRRVASYIEKRHNNFYCLLCTIDVTSETWENHVSSTKHVATVEQFNLLFQECCSKLYCIMCDDFFSWNDLEDHARMHLMLPWYKPDDLYTTFISNKITKYENEYLCCLCDSTFSEWFTAYIHLIDPSHIKLKVEFNIDVKKILSEIPTGVTHELIVSEGLIALQTGILECKICRNTSIQCCNVQRHIEGILHKLKIGIRIKTSNQQIHEKQIDGKTTKQTSNYPEINEPISTPIEVGASNETHCDTDASKPLQDAAINYISVRNEVSYCMICDIECNQFSVKDHLMSTSHIAAQKRLGCNNITLVKNTEYYCKYCCCLLSGVESIYKHLMGRRHASCLSIQQKQETVKLKKSPELSEKQMADIIKSSTKVPAKDYILNRNKSEFYCTICYKALCGHANLRFHLQDEQHTDALKKHGCDYILLLNTGDYYCSCCEDIITDFQNVLIHLKQLNHKRAVSKINKLQANTIISEETRDSTDVYVNGETDRQFEVCDFVVRTSPTNVYCGICEYSFSSYEEADNHMTGETHRSSLKKFGCDNIVLKDSSTNTYYCSCCGCTISGTENVILHAKGKKHQHQRHQIGTGIKSPEKPNEQEVPTKEKTSVPEKLFKSPGQVKIDEQLCTKASGSSKLEKRLKINPIKPIDNPHQKQANRLLQECTNKHDAHKNFDCYFCNMTLSNHEALHGHLARHVSLDLCKTRNGTREKKSANYSLNDHNMNNLSLTPAFSEVEISDDAIETKNTNSIYKDALLITSVTSVKSDDSEINTDTLISKSSDSKINLKKVLRELDLDKNLFYDLIDKLQMLKLSMNLSFPVDDKNIYCLVCKEKVPQELQKHLDHLYSVRHSECFEKMEIDNIALQKIRNQYSVLHLAYEYMAKGSENIVRCYACKEVVDNVYEALRDHINDETHKTRSSILRKKSTTNFVNNVQPRILCDWYNVYCYWCVPCEKSFFTEIDFHDHLESPWHGDAMQLEENIERKLIYDFCPSCGVLWYGYRCTYAYHHSIPAHKWLLRDGYYVLSSLPEFAKGLLETSERFIEDTIKDLDSVAAIEQQMEQTVVNDIERKVKDKYPKAKVYMFGSRASDVSSPNSDIDVFLDCGNIWGVEAQKKKIISNLIADVNKRLSNDTLSWNVVELKTTGRLPIIRTHHRSTGLSCDISFNNWIGVEKTRLIKSFIDAFPLCRKVVIFLKRWLISCNLTGSESITNYALYWCVIFHLQKESILPSVATLIAEKNESCKIDGWEVGVSHNIRYNKAGNELGFKELLKRFFKFYGNFDFRYEVVCPLLGEEVKKRDFVIPQNLPKPMEPYIKYLKKSDDAEPFRMDSVMCVQDPLDLQHNLTKSVKKIYMTRFRTFCLKSLDVLTNS